MTTPSPASAPRECPFGCVAPVLENTINYGDHSTFARCSKCGTFAEIGLWNTRPLESALRSRIAALEARLEKMHVERDEARQLAEQACDKYNETVAERGQILRCAFCGEKYKKGTPSTKHAALTAHVMVCKVHPMREVEKRLAEIVDSLYEDDTATLTDSEITSAQSRAPAKAKEQENG